MDRTVHFVSLGCAKNRVDTEVMLGVAGDRGWRHVDDPSDAQVVVVNTCGFIGPAKEESIDTIVDAARLKEEGACETLVVAGCLSQRYGDELADELPEVDVFLGSSDMLKLRAVLDSPSSAPRMQVGNPAEWTLRATDPRQLSVAPHSAYVKIAEGCNRKCSFCAIPAIRGGQRSRPIDDVVREVEQLAAQGTVEANLISQDTVGYGRDRPERPRLHDLVRHVADVQGLQWLRLHYLYPETLQPELLDLFANHPNVLPYVDMPLQHVSDRMLRRMRRGHGGPRIRRVVETLRARVPQLVFRTTFIVGHPGETEDDFRELCAFVEEAELDHAGVFLYSHEEGTASGSMEDRVEDDTARARQQELFEIQRRISRRKQRAHVGREIDVLVDGVSDQHEWLLEGRWWGQAPEVDGKVYLANGTAQPGTFRRAKVTDAADYDLLADLIDDGAPTLPERNASRSRAVRLPTV